MTGKWAVLSVAHAAENFCNMLLTELTPRRHRGRYPALDKAAKILKRHNLSPWEKRVVCDVFPPVAQLRNKLMHGPVPTHLKTVDATVALLALLYLSRRRLGVSASELFDQDPPIERDVLEELGLCAVTRRHFSAGANPARQLSLQPVTVGADDGGNDIV